MQHLLTHTKKMRLILRVILKIKSIQYVRPFFSKTANGHDLNDREGTYGNDTAANDEYDPWDYSKGGDFNSDDFRKALFEDTRDRANQELANVLTQGDFNSEDGVNLFFKALSDEEIGTLLPDASDTAKANAKFLSQKWGTNGSNYVDGYVTIYGYNDGDSGESVEKQLIAFQDKRSGEFFAAPGFTVTLEKPVALRDKFHNTHESGITIMPGSDAVKTAIEAGAGVMTVTIKTTNDVETKAPWYKEGTTKIRAFGRFNSESDFEGNYLGEVEIRLTDYQFKPQMTSIGVSWSQLTEITLSTSYNLSAEELLVSYASQEIRSALDYRSVRLAYTVAKSNASHNPNYYYVFDAAYSTGKNSTDTAGVTTSNGTKDGYRENALTFVSAIDAVGDIIYDEINRGGVSKLCGGPSAVSYLKLATGLWSPKGKQSQRGAHQEGEFDGKRWHAVSKAA